jgi:putative PIN family toxin of toxin-antitoxin system
MIRTVLDTNVLVSAMLSPFGNEAQVLGAVRRGSIVPCLSPAILAEYCAVLSRPKFGFAQDEILGLIGMLEAKGLLLEPVPATGASPDPGDDDFIACALAADADFIVTGNKRDFPADSCKPSRVVSARELMAYLNETQAG